MRRLSVNWISNASSRLSRPPIAMNHGELTDVPLLQPATSSRERVEQYQITRSQTDESAGLVSGRFSEIGHPVATYIHRPVRKSELTDCYVAPDLILVMPVWSGMNLVTEEYMTACTDGEGRSC